MSKTNLPGFTAGASLYETTSSYRSRVTQPEGGGHAIFAQGWGSAHVRYLGASGRRREVGCGMSASATSRGILRYSSRSALYSN